MTVSLDITRRGFVAGAGAVAGLTLGFSIPFGREAAEAKAAIDEINAWVVVKPDDQVIIRIARSEMGQGTLTGLAQLVAEELECDWSKVTTEYPSPATNLERGRIWQSFSTGGSRGIRESHDYVRQGGAAAREMLIAAAAKDWGVSASDCTAVNSVITHKASNRSTTYGKVAVAASKLEPPKEVQLKDPKDWKLAGKPVKRLDTADKLTGKQIYGVDLKLPGMLNASIKACPVFGGKLASFDDSKVKSMPGVRGVVAVGEDAVAVVAETWWQANSALQALPIVWDEGENKGVTSETIREFVAEGLDAKDAFVGNEAGDIDGALKGAAKTVEATYTYPFQHHATMEPMNATAKWTEERCEVWCPTQNGEAALAACAEAAGLSPAQCDVYKIHLGGGFGRRGAFHDYVRQAVMIAMEFPGTPVKLIWTREEDMAHGMYHPYTQCKLTAALDENGDVTGLRVRIAGQSILASVMPQRMKNGADMVTFQTLLPGGEHSISYSFPNLLVDHAMRNPPVPPGFWRGVNANQNAIYMECFLDEVAHATGQDPLEFRLKLMGDYPKNAAVLKAAAEGAGWGKPAPEGVYRGLAQCTAFASHIAACAEVSVSDDGKVKIHRIVAATDSGHAVNPQQIEAQVEGSFVYGLSAMLYGECTVKGGRVEQQNFDTYRVMTISEMPEVETVVMPSGGFWGGVGEPTIAVAAPAVLNAIFAATGKRIRTLPLKHHSLAKA
ncbi:Isoquinoline 1-oxidoreductase subunit beta [Candidatus Filomicrobium marinum]|uniref:Isoquinoline 1-oxidoreductase subunit beta n=1 Tax=Candidatus Filomicrobium marinum TaxID=1608628 RepID=A0A0D6JBM3_9HYPH|nr:molybdopterin cofactor-binding domain-containing protein [Candidatus Filomicrobium marinum]CFX03578.1 Isoquinoline 1-oxidoreductase subunit beta [Candidatus Filomicrobium marinum]CPR15881.1 Isoquinoline 1-oxidoreductase subunit beta [Candidatus Filomicrobium marinum]